MGDEKSSPKRPSTAHLAPYQFKPGGKAPPGVGRPAGLASRARKVTKNGRELVDFFYSVKMDVPSEGVGAADSHRS